MKNVFVVARREISTHLRKASFYLVTIVTPLIAVLMLLGISAFGVDAPSVNSDVLSERPSRPSGYVDQAGVIQTIPDELHQFFIPYANENDAAAALRSGDVPAYFVIAPDYAESGRVTKISQQVGIFGAQGADTRALTTLLRANVSGDVQLAQRLDRPLDLDTEVVGGPTAGSSGDAASPFSGVGFGAALLLAFAIINGGSWLVQAVAEEKENRTVEVVLTSLRAEQLMAGKLLGLGVLALLQLALWGVFSGGALAAGVALGVSLAMGMDVSIWVWMVVFFVLGFLFYGSLMMALGALGATVRESSQVAGFMTIPMLVPLYFAGLLLEQPNGVLAQVLSYIPFTAPVTVVLRLGAGDVPLWHILISVALLAVSVVGAIWLAARVFRASTLLTGTKPSVRALIQIARGT